MRGQVLLFAMSCFRRNCHARIAFAILLVAIFVNLSVTLNAAENNSERADSGKTKTYDYVVQTTGVG